MKAEGNDYSAEDEKFLRTMDSHHKMGIQMCKDVVGNSSNPDVIDIANNIIRSLYFQMQEIQNLMH